MAYANDYKEALKKLSPRGKAWPTDDSSNWVKLLNALAQEFFRVEQSANRLIQEVYPDTTIELLEDWERVAGLPDPCTGSGGTIKERRADLLAVLTARGGQSIQYFIQLALELGYIITITEFDAFYVGESSVDDIILDSDWEFVWQVNAPAITVIYFIVGQSAVGESLGTWSNQRLECVIRSLAPAHTIVLFSYS